MIKFPYIKFKNRLTGNEYLFSKNRSKGKDHNFEIEEFDVLFQRDLEFLDDDGKIRKFSIPVDDFKELFENFVQFHRSESQEIVNFTHDIQYLVGSLVHNSIVKPSQLSDNIQLKSKLDKINIISIIIMAKNTYFRYLTEDIDFLKKEKIDISGKTFKVSKSIPFLAESRGKRISSEFSTSGNSNYSVNMINIFDFIPFQVIENGIKYSPMEGDIDISVHSTSDDVTVSICSMGPELLDGETELIFEKGYRGVNGKKFESTGHGLGLFQTRKALTELCSGRISVRQKPSFMSIDGLPFCETHFDIRIPK